MKYELIVSRKSKESDSKILYDFMDSLEATQVERVVWQFTSEKEFAEVLLEAHENLDDSFRYFLLLLDDSEDNHVPKNFFSNDRYINYCRDRLKDGESTGLYTLRKTSQLNFSRLERRFRKQEDETPQQ